MDKAFKSLILIQYKMAAIETIEPGSKADAIDFVLGWNSRLYFPLFFFFYYEI